MKKKSAGTPEVTVILPVYEEEQSIGAVIDEVAKVVPDAGILIAFTPGRDGTIDVLMEKMVKWITCIEKGKGNAVRKTIEFIKSPLIIMMDADYTYPAAHITEMLQCLETNDVVIGCRKHLEPGSMWWGNLVGNRILSLSASILYGKRVHDVCSGMWAFRKDALDKFKLEADGFTLEADLFINSTRNGTRIKQIPITYRPRASGTQAKLKMRDGVKILWFLLRRRFTTRS